jgi:FixJ family two-component response regulator
VIVVVAVLLLQAAMIIALMFEHYRRHRAELESRCHLTEMAHLSRTATAGTLSASGSTLPVIFITATDDESTRKEALETGCIAYLQKPFPARLLIDAIGKAGD